MADTPRKDVPTTGGQLIVAEAATWKGTPYSLSGEGSIKGRGGDCSGTTYKIYSLAQCPYVYQQAANFPAYAIQSGLFRKLDAVEPKQEGDILSWPDHMAIYSSFLLDPANATTPRTNNNGRPWTQNNDMWTATHRGGGPYCPNQMRWFKPSPPTVFRYQK